VGFSFSVHLLERNGNLLGFVPKSIRKHPSTTNAKGAIMTDMIKAQKELEKEIRTLRISWLYRLYENAEKRGGFDETFKGRAVQFHIE
jgi:hypothetical protein